MGRPKKIKLDKITCSIAGAKMIGQSIDCQLPVPKDVLKDITKISLTKEQKEKIERLHKVMNEVNREQKGIVLKFAKDEPDKERLPFGVKVIDELTGNGGIAGNFIIVWGSESVGKTSLCLSQIAEAQKRNKICAYIDLEHGFSKERAIMFGVNLEELVLVEDANNAEEAMDWVLKLSREKVVDLIVIDSIQAMSTKAENEAKSGKERLMEEDEIASLAKKMGKFLRRCATPIYKAKIAVTMVGQSRTGGIGTFAAHEELTGGRAQKHWSLLTLFMRQGHGSDAPSEKMDTGEVDEDGKAIKVDRKIGFDLVVKIQKTKTNSKPEGYDVHLPFFFTSGFLKNS